MNNNSVLTLIFLLSPLFFSSYLAANYWLIMWTYRQGPEGRPEVSRLTSPFVQSIQMRDLDTHNKTGKIIITFTNLSGNLIVNVLVYLVEIIDITF